VRGDVERADLLRLGPRLEHAGRFPERTNVQLVQVDGPHEVSALVWERGAGETSASGSSAVAVASAAIANGWCESPVTVRMPGGELLVEADEENRLTLVGPAEEICTGEISLRV
jgi:diaminopimelate epimerase